MPIDNKLGRIVNYCERLPLLQPHDPWSWNQLSSWQFENSLSPLKLAGCWLREESPACKCLSWHWHLACLWFWLPTKHSPSLFHPAGVKRVYLLFVNNLNFNHLFIEFIELQIHYGREIEKVTVIFWAFISQIYWVLFGNLERLDFFFYDF